MSKRNHFFQEKVLDPLRSYSHFSVCLLILALTIRVLEFTGIYYLQHQNVFAQLPIVLGIDAVFALAFASFLYLPFYLAFQFHPLFAKRISKFLIYTIALIYALLEIYFLKSFALLGADIWGYSFDDILLTIKASTSVPFYYFPLFLVFPYLFVKLYTTFTKHNIRTTISPILLALVLILASYFAFTQLSRPGIFSSDIQTNKAFYFSKQAYSFYRKSANKTDFTSFAATNTDYPFYKEQNYTDVFGPYLNKATSPPNFVIIQVEGLGRSFTGAGADFGGFTPFLDSLSEQSLYWENFLSTTGRTFGILPSLLGSLPFGKAGFNELGSNMPQHESLISLLKEKNYFSSYFYGGDSRFDKQDVFLKKQGINQLLDERTFPKGYNKMKANDQGFSWGFTDKDLFNVGLSNTPRTEQSKLSVYMTLQTHEPFNVPDERYHKLYNARIKNCSTRKLPTYVNFRGVFECLLYTDDAIKNFIEAYKSRPDYANTIFIITGDHRLIPVPHRDMLDRFRVPLIVWSPLLKKAQKFRSLGTHSQLTPSILAYLKNNYGMRFPKEMAFIAKGLSTKTAYSSDLDQAFMRNKGSLDTYIYKNMFLDNGVLYKIDGLMGVSPLNDDEALQEMNKKLRAFSEANTYVCTKNKLYPNTNELDSTNTYLATSTYNYPNLDSDSLLTLANEAYYAKALDSAEILVNAALQKSPSYADLHLLKGKLLVAKKEFTLAEKEFELAYRYQNDYEAVFEPYLECLYKLGKIDLLEQLCDKGLVLYPENKSLLLHYAFVLKERKNYVAAHRVVNRLLKKYPGNVAAKNLLKEI